MVKMITLRFEGTCADMDCRAVLPVGSKAKWYGRGKVYGVNCHEAPDGFGLRWANGRSVQGNGMCEDAPACGCCGTNPFGGNPSGMLISYGD